MGKEKLKLTIKSKLFGNTYHIFNEKTGKEFIINEYPKRDRSHDSAKYGVSEAYGNFIGKTRTLQEAKKLIKEVI